MKVTLFVLWNYLFGPKKEKRPLERKVDKSFRVLLVGASGSGKSTITKRYENKKFETNSYSSSGPNYKRILTQRNGKYISVDIVDTPGRKDNRDYAFRYIDGSTIVVLVFDVTNEEAFKDDVMYWAAKIHESNAMSYFLLANKVDLQHERKISTDEGMKWAQKFLFAYAECSAKTNDGIEELLELIISKCMANYNLTPTVPPRYAPKDEFNEYSYHLPFENVMAF